MVNKYLIPESELANETEILESCKEGILIEVVKLSDLNELLDDFKRKCKPRAIPRKDDLWYCWKDIDWKKLRDELK